MSRETPETCPSCGADVPPGAKACPECGSDEQTGWSDEAYTSNLGIPEEKFDYNEFVEQEFGSGKPKPRPLGWLWLLVAVILGGIILFLALAH